MAHILPPQAPQIGFWQARADPASVHRLQVSEVEHRFLWRCDRPIHPAIEAVAAKQCGRDAIQGDPCSCDVHLARSAQCHREVLLRDLLYSVVQSQGRPSGEIGLIRLGRGCHQSARFGRRHAQEPVAFFERSAQTPGRQPAQGHGGGGNTQARQLRGVASRNSLMPSQFLIECNGSHDAEGGSAAERSFQTCSDMRFHASEVL